MSFSNNITIHHSKDFIKMRQSGLIAAKILDYITPFVNRGVTTNQLNDICHAEILRYDAIPAPLNYQGYPKSICTSVNHVVCHGIPNNQSLNDGDIINIDVTIIKEGWYGDASRMYHIGKITPVAQRLIRTCYEAKMKAIEILKPGIPFNHIGKTIQQYVEKKGFSVVRDYCGHGIGRTFHSLPNILHYFHPHHNTIMKEGMFFTIEPMINTGHYTTRTLEDHWTVITKDHSLSAQCEHTVGITKTGYEIFTQS